MVKKLVKLFTETEGYLCVTEMRCTSFGQYSNNM